MKFEDFITFKNIIQFRLQKIYLKKKAENFRIIQNNIICVEVAKVQQYLTWEMLCLN